MTLTVNEKQQSERKNTFGGETTNDTTTITTMPPTMLTTRSTLGLHDIQEQTIKKARESETV